MRQQAVRCLCVALSLLWFSGCTGRPLVHDNRYLKTRLMACSDLHTAVICFYSSREALMDPIPQLSQPRESSSQLSLAFSLKVSQSLSRCCDDDAQCSFLPLGQDLCPEGQHNIYDDELRCPSSLTPCAHMHHALRLMVQGGIMDVECFDALREAKAVMSYNISTSSCNPSNAGARVQH
jgi:hypothetical protein